MSIINHGSCPFSLLSPPPLIIIVIFIIIILHHPFLIIIVHDIMDELIRVSPLSRSVELINKLKQLYFQEKEGKLKPEEGKGR